MPPLHQSKTIHLLENLNETDDLSAFVRGMCNPFSKDIVSIVRAYCWRRAIENVACG